MNADSFSLRVRDGKLFVVAARSYSDQPIVRMLWWPVSSPEPYKLTMWNIPLEQWDGIALGQWLYGSPRSHFRPIEPGFPRGIEFVLPQRGQTEATWIDEEPIEPPKVRKGIEVRFRHNRWQKFLKAKGWVNV